MGRQGDARVSREPTVLVADDEQRVVEVYSLWLAEEYDVRTATGGREAVELVDGTVDVVLLDRRMPDMTGDEVLRQIRQEGYDCRAGMVTAVDPDFDIVEMDFEAYLTKPITDDDLRDTVEELLALDDPQEREGYALAEKREALEDEKSEPELEDSEEYGDLTERLESLRADIEDTVESINDRTESG
jgi:CheY-like chemotaxis protein